MNYSQRLITSPSINKDASFLMVVVVTGGGGGGVVLAEKKEMAWWWQKLATDGRTLL